VIAEAILETSKNEKIETVLLL